MTTRDEDWPRRLDAAIKEKFERDTETFFDLLGCMRYVTEPTDGEPLTDEIHEFILGWMDALNKDALSKTG